MRYSKPIYYDTLKPYKVIEHTGIEYTVCRDFDHISRYRGLRQVVHGPVSDDRFMTLETPNAFVSNAVFDWYTVPLMEENRLDLIAYKFYGSAQYSWIISYFNNIEDGFTCNAGQNLKIPKTVTDLMKAGQILQSVPATSLNLSFE